MNDNTTSTTFNWRDKRYSTFYRVVDQIVNELQEMVWSDGKRKKRLKGDKLDSLHHSVEKLVSDTVSLVYSKKRRSNASIHKALGHYKHSRYNQNLSYRIHIHRAYDGMCDLGYLNLVLKGASDGAHGKYLTRYEATPKLLSLFSAEEQELCPVIIPHLPQDETIRVQVNEIIEEEGKRPWKRTKTLDYEETPEVVTMRSNLKVINDSLLRNWYDLELSDDAFLEMEQLLLNKDQTDISRQLNLSRRTLHRVFNDVHFKTGGRFYGAWWQFVPKKYRSKLLVNGKRMVEYDYSNLHPTILYAEAGLTAREDAYADILFPRSDCPKATGKGCRSAVKKAMNAMLNATKTMTRPPGGFKPSDYGTTWKELSSRILKRHHKIADKFYTGQGQRLQRIDSQIAEKVLLHFTKYGNAILPLHDSFLVHSGYEMELEEVMLTEFKKLFDVPIHVSKNTTKLNPQPAKDSIEDNSSGINIESILESINVGYEKRLDAFRNLRSIR